MSKPKEPDKLNPKVSAPNFIHDLDGAFIKKLLHDYPEMKGKFIG